MGTSGCSRIAAALQKVGVGNSLPRYFNQAHIEELGSGVVVTVTDPVSIHLKDIDRGEDLVLKKVVDLQVRTEGGTVGVESDSLPVGDVNAVYGCLSSAEITDKRILVGGWHMIQEHGDCGKYFEKIG